MEKENYMAFSWSGSNSLSRNLLSANVIMSPKRHASVLFRPHIYRADEHQSPIDSHLTVILSTQFAKWQFHMAAVAAIDSSAVPAPENSVRSLMHEAIGFKSSTCFNGVTTLIFLAWCFATSGVANIAHSSSWREAALGASSSTLLARQRVHNPPEVATS